MPISIHGLSVHTRIVAVNGRQDYGLFEQHSMVSVVESMLGICGLLRLAQTAATAVFTHAGPDATLRGADINLDTRSRHAVYATRRHRISSVLYRPEKLLDLLGRLVNRSDAMPRQQSAYAVRHSPADRRADKLLGHRQARRIRASRSGCAPYLPRRVAVVLQCSFQITQLEIQ